MNASTILKIRNSRLEYERKWLYYDEQTNEWVINEQKYGQQVKEIYRTSSEISACEKLILLLILKFKIIILY